jgi:hypothetical protein
MRARCLPALSATNLALDPQPYVPRCSHEQDVHLERIATTRAVGARHFLPSCVPVRFDLPSWEALFTEHGWRIREIPFLGEESRRLHQPVPLPPPDRVMRVFTSRPLRDIGCAIIERIA